MKNRKCKDFVQVLRGECGADLTGYATFDKTAFPEEHLQDFGHATPTEPFPSAD
jgi:hypothetical protein